jgi:serine/threonine protein kinase
VNFRSIPNEYVSFLQSLMAKDPKQRITASGCLKNTIFQVLDTKDAATKGDVLIHQKLDAIHSTITSMAAFLPAIQKNLNLLISDANLPPGRFIIPPIDNSFSLTDNFYKKYKINFICEFEAGITW